MVRNDYDADYGGLKDDHAETMQWNLPAGLLWLNPPHFHLQPREVPSHIFSSTQNILHMIFRWGRTQGLSPHSVFGAILYLCRRLSDPFLHILCLSQTGWANIFVSLAITTNLVKKRNIIFEDLRLTMNLAWFSVMIYFSGLINPQAVNKRVQ